LYLNGAMIGTKQVMGRFQSDATPLILGGNGNNSDVMELFPGRIDEIALYNRPLSPLEIQQLAQGPIPP
ncbi:MAG TPA: LamG-like jellyroll fold domain-containing protein, partial [Polyangia bacterium]